MEKEIGVSDLAVLLQNDKTITKLEYKLTYNYVQGADHEACRPFVDLKIERKL